MDLTEYLGLTKGRVSDISYLRQSGAEGYSGQPESFPEVLHLPALPKVRSQTVPFRIQATGCTKRLDMNSRLPPPIRRYGAQRSVAQRGQNDMEVLGRLFLDFNEHLPEDYRGRPLAPSDVVELDCQGKRTYFYE